MPTYTYRAGYRPALKDPQAVGDKLQELRDKHKGLTASIVIEDAKNKNSVLHGAFEWNDSKAAHEWRLHSARHLMRAVITKELDSSGEIRYQPAFVFVKTEEGPRYESLARVLDDDEMRLQVINRALKEFEQWQKRYKEYEEFLSVFESFDKTRKRLEQEHSAVAQA
jgi:glutamate synthase domain-containing protein 2